MTGLSTWHWFGKRLRYRKDVGTRQVTIEVQDWDDKRGYYWRPMTAEEKKALEEWKKKQNDPGQ